MKVTEAMLETNWLLKPVCFFEKTEANGVTAASLNGGKRVKYSPNLPTWQQLSVRHRRVSPRHWTSSLIEPARKSTSLRTPMKIRFGKEERKTDNAEQGIKKLKKSRSTYKSSKLTILKVIEPVSNLFGNAFYYHMYDLIKQLARQYVDVVHELHRRAKNGHPNEGRAIIREEPLVGNPLCIGL